MSATHYRLTDTAATAIVDAPPVPRALGDYEVRVRSPTTWTTSPSTLGAADDVLTVDAAVAPRCGGGGADTLDGAGGERLPRRRRWAGRRPRRRRERRAVTRVQGRDAACRRPRSPRPRATATTADRVATTSRAAAAATFMAGGDGVDRLYGVRRRRSPRGRRRHRLPVRDGRATTSSTAADDQDHLYGGRGDDRIAGGPGRRLPGADRALQRRPAHR